jgi:hypothetical protein
MLPEHVYFEGHGVRGRKYKWERVAYRAPKKGEHYLSGADPMAYQARADFTPGSQYLIVKPTTMEVLKWPSKA